MPPVGQPGGRPPSEQESDTPSRACQQRFRWEYGYTTGSRGMVGQVVSAAEWKVVDATTWWDTQPGAVRRVQTWETTRDLLDAVENIGAFNARSSRNDYTVSRSERDERRQSAVRQPGGRGGRAPAVSASERGQRTHAVKTGTAFAAEALHAWGYDAGHRRYRAEFPE